MSTERPLIGGFYRHFKNKLYQVLQIAVHSETGEELVIYQALYGDFKVYARPLDSFMSDVDAEKYPDAMQKKRFVRVNLVKAKAQDDQKEQTTREDQKVQEEQTLQEDQSGRISEAAADRTHRETTGSITQNLSHQETRKADEPDPRLLAFLDAGSAAEKWNIYTGFEEQADVHLLNAIAASLDIELAGANTEEAKDLIRDLLSAKVRYEKLRAF